MSKGGDEVLLNADYSVRINMDSKVESLNVSVAAGIILYELCKAAVY